MPVLLKPLQGGRPIVLDKPILLIGRHPDCDVILKNSAKISRKHCCVALVDNHFVVRDLDSMNGVWVNGERVDHSANLRNGDELMIGDLPFTLTRSSEEKRPRSSETVAEVSPRDVVQTDSSQHDAAAVRAAALKKRSNPANAGAAEGVEFSSAFAIPLPDDEDDDDYIIPLADFDD